MRQIIRLTESDLHAVIIDSVKRLLGEDVLGDDWREADNVNNNYEPFEGVDDEEVHDASTVGEITDPTIYQ